MRDEAPKNSSRRLSARELADAAVLADLAVLVVVLARLTPFSGLTTVVGAVPFAVLSMRNRARVVGVAFVIAVILTFLLAGFNASTQVLVMATFGGVIGRGFRNDWSRSRTLLAAFAIGWTTVSTLTVGYLWIFAGIRQLNLDALRVQWEGSTRIVRSLGLGEQVDEIEPYIDWIIDYWFLSIPLMQLMFSVLVTLLTIRIARPVVQRVKRAFGEVPEPSDSLRELAAELDKSGDGLTLVTGPNGIGKSTMLRAMIDGRDDRGLRGGTAVVGQRPESQVVGVRVADDLAWGLDRPLAEDEVADALEGVGLTGFGDRETSSLSGGELQRLALAGARVRQPRLLLSDESTSMLDPAGRRLVMDTMRRMADDGTTVVHVSHVDGEREFADRLAELGKTTPGGSDGMPTAVARRPSAVDCPVTVVLDGVSHVHGAGTPWSRPALHEISLGFRPGDRVLVVGSNGSGKSTLAWILAGLLAPTGGTATLDGWPLVDVSEHVGLLVQHTRLQLLRPTVAEESAAFTPDPVASAEALNRMGFGRDDLTRRVDDLSIGQQRRLGLAAQLSRNSRLLVLDEPMAGLDSVARRALVDAVASLDPLTIVVTVTHDLADSRPLGTRIIELHDGRIVGDREDAS